MRQPVLHVVSPAVCVGTIEYLEAIQVCGTGHPIHLQCVRTLMQHRLQTPRPLLDDALVLVQVSRRVGAARGARRLERRRRARLPPDVPRVRDARARARRRRRVALVEQRRQPAARPHRQGQGRRGQGQGRGGQGRIGQGLSQCQEFDLRSVGKGQGQRTWLRSGAQGQGRRSPGAWLKVKDAGVGVCGSRLGSKPWKFGARPQLTSSVPAVPDGLRNDANDSKFLSCHGSTRKIERQRHTEQSESDMRCTTQKDSWV